MGEHWRDGPPGLVGAVGKTRGWRSRTRQDGVLEGERESRDLRGGPGVQSAPQRWLKGT